MTRLAIDFAEPFAAWRAALPNCKTLCRAAAAAALAVAGRRIDRAVELSIVLGDDALLRDLNRRWRGQDKPTNVLSFPASDDVAAEAPLLLGDVVLAYETVAAEARQQGKTLADHLCHLVVHGVLHLLGFDHVDPAAATMMEGLEVRALVTLGVADPYREAVDG
jgi:probable rRNA maturation factor